MRSIRRPLAAWLAIFSLLLNGFTPLVAHAVTNAQPAAMPICNASGNATPDAPAKANLHRAHCAFCNAHANDAPILHARAALPAYFAANGIRLQLAAPVIRHAGQRPIDAQPRAPPVNP